nr:MAG TPA: hypothetical protein [Caudoviricetes sp.]
MTPVADRTTPTPHSVKRSATGTTTPPPRPRSRPPSLSRGSTSSRAGGPSRSTFTTTFMPTSMAAFSTNATGVGSPFALIDC